MTERVLDWVSHHDPASRNYDIAPLLAGARLRSYTWRCDAWNDQGSEGACVGFAWSHELTARPVVRPTSATEARRLYRRAQQIDEWAGEAYEGTSVLAGAKAVRERGGLIEFRWAFSLDDLARAVGHTGPAVLGIPWLEGMFDTDRDGYVRATGSVAGGHAILARGVNFKGRYFTLRNSWGKSWGRNGDARITFDDLAKLLADDGEACIPVRRKP